MKKTAFITGASSGIGASLSLLGARLGYNLVLMARSAEGLEQTAIMCRNEGADVLLVQGDVSKETDCKRAIELGLDKFQRLDVLINNAGISMRAVFAETEPDVLKKLMDVNFWGTVYCTKYALPALLESKGTVAGVSSIAGFKGLPGRTGYSASKFAMHGFLESLRCENLKTGLHVLIACPGYTKSNIRNTALDSSGASQSETPLNEDKLMHPDEVAERLWNAIHKKRLYMILTVVGKFTVFINKWFPKLADTLAYNYIRKEPGSPFK